MSKSRCRNKGGCFRTPGEHNYIRNCPRRTPGHEGKLEAGICTRRLIGRSKEVRRRPRHSRREGHIRKHNFRNSKSGLPHKSLARTCKHRCRGPIHKCCLRLTSILCREGRRTRTRRSPTRSSQCTPRSRRCKCRSFSRRSSSHMRTRGGRSGMCSLHLVKSNHGGRIGLPYSQARSRKQGGRP